MYWLIPSILTAFFVATQDAWVKRVFSDLDAQTMAAYPMLYSVPLLLAVFPFIAVPALDTTFYWSFLVGLPLNGIFFLLYIQAIRIAPLSLTLPYLSFTPAFILITGILLLGEIPNPAGIGGVMLIVAGCYVLNINPDSVRLLDPFRALSREKGSLLMLAVAFLFGFAAVLGKLSIIHSSPVFFAVSFFTCLNLLVPLFLVTIGSLKLRSLTKRPLQGMIAGGLLFAHVISHCIAISMTKTVYMISIKRFSILIGIVYGRLWFAEEQILIRFAGGLMMVIGSIVILLLGQ